MFYGDCTDQNRLTFPIQLTNLFGYCLHFARLGLKNQITKVLTSYRHVGWNSKSFQTINLIKFFFRSESSTSHARKLLRQTKIILERNRGKGAAFFLNAHPFFGLYRLMQTFRPAPAGLKASGKSVHDYYF